MKTYDGTTQEFIYSPSIYDFYIDDGYLYVLETDGDVFQTEDLSHWQPVESHSTNARQLAVHGDTMFLGDKDGNIWVSNRTFPRPPIAYLPAVYYLLED